MLKTDVLLNIFVETDIFLGFIDEYKLQKNSIYLKYFFCKIINVFTLFFDQFNVSLENKIINFNCTDLKLLNGYEYIPQPSESTTNCTHSYPVVLREHMHRLTNDVSTNNRSLTAGHLVACVQRSSLANRSCHSMPLTETNADYSISVFKSTWVAYPSHSYPCWCINYGFSPVLGWFVICRG